MEAGFQRAVDLGVLLAEAVHLFHLFSNTEHDSRTHDESLDSQGQMEVKGVQHS
jgi:hypothetical protein